MDAATPASSLATRAKLFRGLADGSRLGVLEALRSGPRNVGEIVGETGLGQSNVSNHLACLLDCGLVAREQRGRYVFYGLSDPRVEALLAMADELLSQVAHGVEACPRYARPDEGRLLDRPPAGGTAARVPNRG